MPTKFIVITSINGITDAVKAFAKKEDWHVVVVGDKKTPELEKNPHENVTYLSVEEQSKLGFDFYEACPFNHYVRKNLGYLYALSQGAEWIADSDDDNFPYDDWGNGITETASMESVGDVKIVNVYSYFTDNFIWPRGLPLQSIQGPRPPEPKTACDHKIGVWQGLADKDPDVDAIYRLVLNKPVTFDKRAPLALESGTYCPFNSQNTIWTDPKCFPYLYIPLSVTFRFCDILRGYIAQRGLWALQSELAFTEATVYQERNEHDFMIDFNDEVPVYQEVSKVMEFLDQVELEGDASKDIVTIYKGLQKLGIVDERDVVGVQAFTGDMIKTMPMTSNPTPPS